MIKLVDMKRPPRQKKEKPISVYSEPYFYGLRITLEEQELKKLGLNVNDFKVKEIVNIIAEARVENIESSMNASGRNNQSISLQIIKLSVQKGKRSKFREYYEKQKERPGGIL